MTREEEIKQAIDQMFPYYEDMSDIEVLQTTSRRIGAEKAFEYADEHPKDNLVDIDKAAEWWENELTYPTMTQMEIDWCKTKIAEFIKAMKGE